ncbi:oligosaccharide flippase family protein [Myxosarcina sp. GI1]|uniref:oligosaccharide flippase family protein n=1 Tax=Myxosarcina sp. GI1 TaxID=1541065 RepID=UPI00056539FB|nr:oligosaccharide flippase family protein [Myxosarcina sp. GI1]
MSEPKNIKNKVLRGGIFLTLRQLLSSGLSVISMLVIARSLGPEKYGIVVSSLGVFYFLTWTGQMGLNMYLVRQPNLQKKEVEQLVAFYNTVGLAFCGLMWMVTPLFSLWTGVPEVSSILRWLMLAVWLNMVGDVSISMLSRELKFDQVSLVDGISQIANYSLSVSIVLFTGSYWGPLTGIFLQYFIKACWAYTLHPVRFTFWWQWSYLKKIMFYGVPFFVASWVQTLRSLTIPLIITPLAGVEAAGIVGVTLRMVEQLSLLRIVIRQMSISVIAKFIEDSATILRAINQGMNYLALIMVSVCATFACISPWLIPTLFGTEWSQSTKIFPLVAFAASVSAVFDLHQATLHAVGRNNIVTIQNSTYIASLWLICWCLIPALGLWGYAIAEIVALPNYYVSHREFKFLYESPNYWNAALIILTAVPSLLASIFVSPIISFTVLFFSYTTLITINSNLRKILVDLLSIARSKKQKGKLDIV